MLFSKLCALRVGITAGALLMVATCLAPAQEDAKREDAPASSTAAQPPSPKMTERIERSLKETIVGTWEFTDTPLTEVVSQIKEDHGIEVQLGLKSLEECGVDGATVSFSLNVAAISLEDALDLLLAQHSLTFVVKNSVLLVTTEDVAEGIAELRVYNVGDLAVETDDFHKLTEILISTVAPEGWDENGGPGTVVEYPKLEALVVLQTRRTHLKIEALLDALRETKKITAARSVDRG